MRIPLSAFLLPLSAFSIDAAPGRDTAEKLLGAVPMRFEENRGQLPPHVRYASRFGEQQVFLTDRGALLPHAKGTLRVSFSGSREGAALVPEQPLMSKSAHFAGNRPSEWRSSIPHFGAVRARSVFPGVDLLYRTNSKRLEYDFLVAPGADPSRIRVWFDGASKLSIDGDGALIIQAGESEFRQPKPVVFQEAADGRREIAGAYRLTGRNRVGFVLGEYDRSRPLVIDPILARGTYFGGPSVDTAIAAAFDSRGRLWVTGSTTSRDLPTSGSPYRDARIGGRDVFVAVFNPLASGPDSLIYSTYLGGTGDDEPRALAIDSAGTAHVAGFTTSTDFPVRNGYQNTMAGDRDAFVAQVNLVERGEASLWYSSLFGGPLADIANAVAVRGGLIYLAGQTTSVEFPLLGDSPQRSVRGGYDAFLVVLDPTKIGSTSGVYSTYFGGDTTDVATGVAIDSSGDVYLTGYTMSENFPIAGTPYQAVYKGKGDLFVARLDLRRAGLDQIRYSTYIGGTDLDQPWNTVLDAAGRLYLTGSTLSTDFPITQGAFQTQSAGDADVFVVRFDPSQPGGREVTYSSYLGGNNTDTAYGLAVDARGRILISGYTFSSDFPVKGDNTQPLIGGGFDAYVAWFDPSAPGATSLSCSSFLGGEGNEVAYGIAVNSAGVTIAVGATTSRQFGIGEEAFQPASAGFQEAFVVLLNSCR
jgi:hypothetical protein